MSRMVWNPIGDRFFEAGVDRGVLYVGAVPGVPWNGLVSVTESSSGVDHQEYYLDGIKYRNRLTSEEFEGTIEAYTYPAEFARCDGTAKVGNGLFATQQKRRPFGLAFRSMVGNDIDGVEHAYKIHIVYDALAEPAEHEHSTLTDSSDAFNFSWHITTKPSLLDGFRPTAHFVIDSRETDPELLSMIEDVLYGTDANSARLPSAGELAYLFTSFETTYYDAGDPYEPAFAVFDAGLPGEVSTRVIDGGVP